MKTKLTIGFLALLVLAGAFFLLWSPSLEKIHRAIEGSYPDVQHISASEFLLLDPAQKVVFDVREKVEYQVSHIQDAIQLSPDTRPEEFEELYGDVLEGKRVVFYCSVGYRSSEMVSRLNEVTEDLGARSSLNLIGGVFNWVNQGHPLSSSKVHPYNEYWGRFIDDTQKLSN